MQLKVIDKDKVKILIEDKDFEELCVPEDITNCNEINSSEFILKLLDQTYIQTGIDFSDSKVLIEVLPGISSAFYIIITRLESKGTIQKQISLKADEDMYLFKLHQLENIFDVSDVFKRYTTLKIGGSRIYKFKNRYYFSIDFPPETVSDNVFYDLIKDITLYSDKCKWNILNEPILCEHGKLLIKNPISCLKNIKNS